MVTKRLDVPETLKSKKNSEALLFFLIFLAILIIFAFVGPTIIGFLAAGEEKTVTQKLNLYLTESQEYNWTLSEIPEGPFQLKSVKVTGYIKGNNGTAKAYLVTSKGEFLILDSKELGIEVSPLTAFSVGEEETSEEPPEEPPLEEAPEEPPPEEPIEEQSNENTTETDENQTDIPTEELSENETATNETEVAENITEEQPTEEPREESEPEITKFTGECIESCTLPGGINSSSYTLRFEVEGTEIFIEEITYTLLLEEYKLKFAIQQAAVCGNNQREGIEACDGSDDAACPGQCQSGCSCAPVAGCVIDCENLKKDFNSNGVLEKFNFENGHFDANNAACEDFKTLLLNDTEKKKGLITPNTTITLTETSLALFAEGPFKVKVHDDGKKPFVEIVGKSATILTGTFPPSLAGLLKLDKRHFKTNGERGTFKVLGVTCEGNLEADVKVEGEDSGTPAVKEFKFKVQISQNCASSLINAMGGKKGKDSSNGFFAVLKETTKINTAKTKAQLKGKEGNKVKFEIKGNESSGEIKTPLGDFADRFNYKVHKERALCTLTVDAGPPQPGVCGNGILEAGEGCDDANTVSGDGCSAVCQIENGFSCSGQPSVCSTTCGDNIVAGIEQCDPPNNVTCNQNCQNITISAPVCGNNIIEQGEQCEPPNTQTCNSNCQIIFQPVCGNGILEAGEGCEPPNTQTCNANCQQISAPVCGNGILEFPEECDDGNTVNNDACSSTCLIEYCGDNICQNVENAVNCASDCNAVCGNSVCEPPTENSNTCSQDCPISCTDNICSSPQENKNNCPSDCISAICGNNACETGENNVNCPADCSAVCGNFVCEPPENNNNCSSDCIPTCSNSVCESGENAVTCPADCSAVCGNSVCEPPTENATSCSSDCLPSCGNGACDGGLGENSDTCPTDCPILQCGNGIQEDGEKCDLTDLKNNTCTTIGQGFTGGTLACTGVCTFDTSGCTITVTPPPGPAPTGGGGGGGGRAPPAEEIPAEEARGRGAGVACGNGIIERDEECDDGNLQSGDGCSSLCKLEAVPALCGNGILDIDEECDDGNNVSGDGCSQTCKLEVLARLGAPTALFFGSPGAIFGWLILLAIATIIFFNTSKGKEILARLTAGKKDKDMFRLLGVMRKKRKKLRRLEKKVARRSRKVSKKLARVKNKIPRPPRNYPQE